MNMSKALAVLVASVFTCAFSLNANAASDEYKAAKKQEEANYEKAKAECKKLSGSDQKACMKKAHGDHEAAEERLEAKK